MASRLPRSSWANFAAASSIMASAIRHQGIDGCTRVLDASEFVAMVRTSATRPIMRLKGCFSHEKRVRHEQLSALRLSRAKTLDLSDCELERDDAAILVNAIKFNAVLTSLNLSVNALGPDGGRVIAAALSEGSSVLTNLNLAVNALCGVKYGMGTYDPSGIQAIAAALSEGSSVLTNLNLADNALCGVRYGEGGTYDPSGIQAIAAALSEGSAVLKKLNLEDNDVGGNEKQMMRDAVKGRQGFELDL